MDSAGPCLVCGRPAAGARCPNCGADQDKVRMILRTTEVLERPAWWRLMWGHGFTPDRMSEAVWAELSPAFKDSVLQEYGTLQRRAAWRCNLVLFLSVVLTQLLGFWAGVHVLQWFHPISGRIVQFLCGVAGGMLFCFPLGMLAENLVLRLPAQKAHHVMLWGLPFCGLAVLRRRPLPWYMNANMLSPVAMAAGLIVAWFLFLAGSA